jgi:glutamine cyclotransferase
LAKEKKISTSSTSNTNSIDSTYTINYINELEYDMITNTILANKIFEDIVLRIDPISGLVLNVYNFNDLYPKSIRTNKNNKQYNKQYNNNQHNNQDSLDNEDGNENNENDNNNNILLPEPDVFNGIAIIPNTNGKEWFVTGKYWDTLYHIRI